MQPPKHTFQIGFFFRILAQCATTSSIGAKDCFSDEDEERPKGGKIGPPGLEAVFFHSRSHQREEVSKYGVVSSAAAAVLALACEAAQY